jgi:glycosyltransferase involved in cell wall biosynthesis
VNAFARAIDQSAEAIPAPAKTVVYVQPTSEVGGSDIALFRLVTHLDRHMYRPVVVLPRPGPLLPKLEAASVRVIVLPMMQLRSIKSLRYWMHFLISFWPTVFRLAALLRAERADIVHTNSLFSLYGPWAALLTRVPHIWHIREIPTVPALPQKMAMDTVLRLSARVIAMTDAVAQLFQGATAGRSKVAVIPDGIDLSAFNPSVCGNRIRRDLGIGEGAPLIGFVGRLDPWKGADVFLRAAAAIAKHRQDAHFVVCGGEVAGYESFAASLKGLGHELGLTGRIHFTGWEYRLDDIPEVMAALDVLVHTSVRPEPFGLVMVEAMATGTPVVASLGGGVAEVVKPNVTGLVVKMGDWSGVAAAVLDLLSNPNRIVEMGKAGRTHAECLFDVAVYVRRVVSLYASVLRTDPRPNEAGRTVLAGKVK